ncbi:hypothetical protein DFH08DRAFT_931419 [Mycena albidolilacea]|uniref:Uncharacterized protein n=1 Tax=Mycena albidolilacea TaxID=1033008 RepID=A0AAD7EZQ1_9AGAR|nr:hypothetical protein DFH08DRAFT_931419 [Mycena albidolilacea]
MSLSPECFRDVLEVHLFAMTENSRINIDGTTNNHAPLAHGYRIRPPTPQGGFSTPPEGLFEWHYLQYVVKLFGTLEYKNMDHITYLKNKLRMQNDDGEGSVDGDGADWPSAVREAAAQLEAEQKRGERVGSISQTQIQTVSSKSRSWDMIQVMSQRQKLEVCRDIL